MQNYFDRRYFYGKEKSNYGNYEKICTEKQFNGIISFIKENNISGKFLDVGCAFGYLLKEISQYFKEFYGCDISSFAIKKAKKLMPEADIRIADIGQALPYKDDFFDCICALDVLEHTKNVEKSLDILIRKLRKGGYLIISMPINAWPRKAFGFLDKDRTHISILKVSELDKILVKRNLEVIKREYFAPMPFIHRIYNIPAEIQIFIKKC